MVEDNQTAEEERRLFAQPPLRDIDEQDRAFIHQLAEPKVDLRLDQDAPEHGIR